MFRPVPSSRQPAIRVAQWRCRKAQSFLILLSLLTCHSLSGHPISLTSAQVDVASFRVLVALEVLLEDLVLFHQVTPDEQVRFSIKDLRTASEEHRSFLLDRLALFDGSGQRLSGTVDQVSSSELSGVFVLQEELMERRVVYTLQYPLSKPLEYLTVVQRFSSEERNVPSIMDLSIRQGEQWLHRPSQLMNDQALTIAINAAEQPKGDESQWETLKRQKQEEAQRRLGISSYSALYSFIYVTPREVRHEVLVPLLTFEEWLSIERETPDRLTVEEQVASIDAIRAFFEDRAPVQINGTWVRPSLERVQFFGVDIRDFAMDAVPRDVSVYQARMGLILRYELGQEPRRVEIPWDIYGEHASAVQSTVFVNDRDPQKVRFWKGGSPWAWESDEPKQETTEDGVTESLALNEEVPVPSVRMWRVPLVSLSLWTAGVIGGIGVFRKRNRRWRGPILVAVGTAGIVGLLCWPLAQVSMLAPWQAHEFDIQNEVRKVGQRLLKIVYTAFGESSELDAYETLSLAVEGDLLEELYLSLKQGLVFQEQGGAVADVWEVDLERYGATGMEIDRQGVIRFQFKGTWVVKGSVEHWGHRHERRHVYTAQLGVLGGASGWRFDQIEVLNVDRSEISTSIR